VTLRPNPAARPPDTMQVRGRLRAVWLALGLAAAAGCVLLGIYGDTPEDTLGSHQIFLSLFLFLAALLVLGAVRGFGRGLDANGDGVVVRNMFRTTSIPWRELAAIEFNGVDSEAISNMYYQLVFQRRDGSRVTAEAPGGGSRPGEYLFELRERLLVVRDAALGDPHAPLDRPWDDGSTDTEGAPPSEPPSWVTPPWSGSTDTEAAPPGAATRSRVKRWGGVVASVAVALAIAFVPLPDLGSLLGDDEPADPDLPAAEADGPWTYWEDLQPGMCVREVQFGMHYVVVDCRVEHGQEVMSRSTLAGNKKWPGDAAVEEAGADKCLSAFADYVGVEIDESRLDFDFLTPDKDSWNDGKGTLICFVLDPSHDQITRALRDAHE
jgi:Septum formation/Bacterial PH domain